jgi:DNA-binding MarR family transcriptional regulator
MGDSGQLNVKDRVLLHLLRFATDVPKEEHPAEITQAGIALAVGISRTHVPRAVNSLMREGLVEELRERVEDHERRMSVYTITPEGHREAEGLWQKILSSDLIVLKGHGQVRMLGSELEALIGRKRAVAAVSRMVEGVIEIDEKPRTPIRQLEDAPAPDIFEGREQELKALDEFMDSDAKIMVLLGNRGYGTTALARKFVSSQDEQDVLWLQLSEGMTVDQIHEKLQSFAKKVEQKATSWSDALNLPNALVVFDDFFSPREEVVEFFSAVVEHVGDSRVIITAREETPAYNWFYHKKHVDSGVVEELRIRGLDPDSAKKLLGNEEIESDAFKRIMMISRGQPMVLRMLRNGDQKGLKKSTVLTSEEIGYLLFLMGKNK